jgi:hypothetical protein
MLRVSRPAKDVPFPVCRFEYVLHRSTGSRDIGNRYRGGTIVWRVLHILTLFHYTQTIIQNWRAPFLSLFGEKAEPQKKQNNKNLGGMHE